MLRSTALALALSCAAAAPGRSLPSPMIGGYTNWGQCDENVTRAARQGVNVILWFSVNLSPSAPPAGGPNMTCAAAVAATLAAEGLDTVHLISIGGWDAPHPVNGTPAQFYAQFKAWNDALQAQYNFSFQGIDWDLEGNDDRRSPWNSLALETLQVVGEMSLAAKADGYIVTLVPAESYFDVSSPLFDRGLLFPYPEWHPDFRYHGRNGYAYLFSRYGSAFDAVTIQLYESWSHAGFNISVLGQRPADYLEAWARALAAGWAVGFDADPALGWPAQRVALAPSQLVVGLANGWAGGGGAPKSVLIMPEEVGVAYAALGGARFRGAAFWCIADEGTVPGMQSQPLFLAEGLNGVFHTRA